jgi:hypothetical protein
MGFEYYTFLKRKGNSSFMAELIYKPIGLMRKLNMIA